MLVKYFLLATVIISFTRASSFINENVAFERVNEITTTRSRWLVAFVIDTNPYQEILTLIAGIFQDIRANLMQTWEVVPNFEFSVTRQTYKYFEHNVWGDSKLGTLSYLFRRRTR